ncbi:MAG TPA: phytanoyl-CoA dioxygenase family protein [Rhizomicrobium sp.]
MKIGDWQATAELNKIYGDARELGLETNIAELEAYGFTIVEPHKVKAGDLFERMLAAVKVLCEQEDKDGRPLGRLLGATSDYTRLVYAIISRNPLFAEALMHPVALTLGRYLMGASCRLFTTSAFVKQGKATPTVLHTDSAGTPPPLYPFGLTCNISWILTDYTEESGTFAMVPGSHRYCRHPTPTDLPKFMGGPNDDNICVPVCAPAGSLIVFNGNTWHGTYPKTSAAFRAHVVTAFCRNYLLPAENCDDVPSALVEKYGKEFAHLLSRNTWQGYKAAGPGPGSLQDVWRANFTPSA